MEFTNCKCIYCDYTEVYYDEVKEAGTILSNEYNQKENEESSWEDFLEDAIELARKNYNYIEYECDYCHDHND